MSNPEVPDIEPTNRVWRMVQWMFRDASTGEIVLWQAPNATMFVAQVASAVRWLDLLPERRREIAWIRSGALVLWALDEVLRGTTPFRRVLGATVLGSQVKRLAS